MSRAGGSSGGTKFAAILVAQRQPVDLAGAELGQGSVPKPDMSGQLERRQATGQEGELGVAIEIAAGFAVDDGRGHFAEPFVQNAEDRGFRHKRMGIERGLHFLA